MRILAIDPSLTATGVATPEGTYTITTKAGDPDRLDTIYSALREDLIGADLAVIEDLPSHAKSAGLTGMAQGVARLALLHAGVPYATVTPATLKKFICGKGNAPKADIRMAIYQRAGIDIPDDNQADAWVLRQIGLHLMGDPERLSLPKTHLSALDKVSLPEGFIQ